MSTAPSESFAPRRDEPIFARLAIIGIGLIGSSIAHAARQMNLAGRVVLADREPAGARPRPRARPRRQRRGDGGRGGRAMPISSSSACRSAPAARLRPRLRRRLKPGAIVSDVGSVKNAVVEAVQPHLPEGVHFVPAHPVAGTENSGPDAGFASLFLNRWCILTPPEGADPAAVAAHPPVLGGHGRDRRDHDAAAS